MSVSNPTPPEYKGVSVEHPRIVEAIRQGAKRGMTKERLKEVTGMPMEVVDKHYKKD